MGRSKFPGKPSKHVNRKRINVLPPPSNAATVEHNIVTVEAKEDTKQVESKNDNDKDTSAVLPEVQICQRLPNRKRTTKRNLVANRGLKGKHNVVGQITKPGRSKIPTRKSVRGFAAGRTLTKVSKETNNLVGKFVLPTRSVHSSRVIKPNKRFINVELSDSRTFKKRVINKRHTIKSDESKLKKCMLRNNEISNKSPEREFLRTSYPETPCSNGRVVLRKARLQLHTQAPIGPDGPFSSNSTGTTCPPGTVTCGVCGAVRFYRFVKQARKFNIYSCESCRKFISKMIKRQSYSKSLTTPMLVCHKGQGTCHVPPIVRSQQWRLIRCAYRARCPACWLKMCLRSFQMPLALKNSLALLLPKYMQGSEILFNSSLPLLTWKAGTDTKTSSPTDKTGEETENVRSLRLKNPKPVEKPAVPPAPLDIKRQKIDLKGPRVKHVCRSASIVLGQPLATFPAEYDKTESQDASKSETKDTKIPDESKESPVVSDSCHDSAIPEEIELPVKDVINKSQTKTESYNIPRRDKFQKQNSFLFSTSEYKLSSLAKKVPCETQNTISIDFWENYDPDEICRTGFGLIASEPFPMFAICFLCGSAGRDALVYCSLCCEPYHPFCLEQSPSLIDTRQKFSWLCPRCTTCSNCNEPGRLKINCQKCHKDYHPECFNNKWFNNDRPTVCSNCLRCRSCGTNNMTKSVGNIPFCTICFKSRRKVSCPLCRGSNDEEDAKMLECGKCRHWLHSKCEDLSDEQYQILSILPETVEFLCSICSKDSTPYWRKAVKSELRSCFNSILRLLSKNSTARNILKWSPLNNTMNPSRPITAAKKLIFSDDPNENSERIMPKDYLNTVKIDTETHHSMSNVKSKLYSNEYSSISEFNKEMEQALRFTHSEEVLNIYYCILKKVFPWYDPKETDATLDKSPHDNFHIGPSINDFEENIDSACIIDVNVGLDSRICALCKCLGDGMAHLESRLLYCGQNEWVHANCALWSSEVYEEIDGSLQNVHSAINRGRSIRCACCKQKGASIGCCYKGCYETYHFNCARTSKCHFMHDKTVYCPTHEIPTTSNPIMIPFDFVIKRSVYVELDRKKKKIVEIEKVHFMVGSLSVTNLGKIIPNLSDHSEAIIPSGFICSRLFWSTVEPWKLVSYVITTSVLSSQGNTVFLDKNFTVDHSLSKNTVERKLKEILIWQKDAVKKSDPLEFEDEEEPQNGADLLSPELTDAILEELPHDLLDGISVQDIFPKLMSYEELLNVDEFSKKHSDEEDDTLTKPGRELKRSKSEFFPQLNNANKLSKARSQQRSCSLTLSCKLDSSLPVMKKRKTTPRDNGMFFQLLQVDGAYDSSSGSECNSPTREIENVWSVKTQEEPVTCERCQCTYRTQASYKRHLEMCEVISTSESDSEFAQENDYVNASVEAEETINEEPYVVTTSYETYSETVTSKTVAMPETTSIYYEDVAQILPSVPVDPLPESEPLTIINQPSMSTEGQYCITQPTICVPTQTDMVTVDPTPLTITQPIVNQQPIITQQPSIPLELQPQTVTIQQVQYAPDTNMIVRPCANVINPVLNMQTVVKPTLVAQKAMKVRPKQRSLASKRPAIQKNTVFIPQTNTATPSLIVQHLPTSSIVPSFVDAFQQQTGQNLQYLTTITPQINNTIAQPSPIIQLQPDGNFINLIPNVQPAVVIQQPTRMVTDQLILDSNGSLTWATQPIYYGFETIVQNTVMQSQQFLPTTVPGVLTANSSYSTTTQVFQTSKLEPVLDVAPNGFMLFNPGLVNQPVQIQQIPQPVITPVPLPQPKPQIQVHKAKEINLITRPVCPPVRKPAPVPASVNCGNSINLPVAPFVSEQGIPTIVVTPTPKVPTSTQVRPMSRVLPIQTTKEVKKVTITSDQAVLPQKEKEITTVDIHLSENIERENILDEFMKPNKQEVCCERLEGDSLRTEQTLKVMFQKQNADALYKIGNNFNSKNCSSVQVVPLKPIKSNVQNTVSSEPKIESIKPSDSEKPETTNLNTSSILYTIESQDGFQYSSTSISDLWSKVFEAVQQARLAHNMAPLPLNTFSVLNNLQLLGLKTNGLKYLVEQLPGAGKCSKYKPSFYFATSQTDDDEFLIGHSFGSIRCAPYTERSEPNDMFGWLASKHRKIENSMVHMDLMPRRASITNLPMAMRFRQLKLTSKKSVGVFRSNIHRRGLFCLRDIEAGEMVIEYAGEVIRSILTDKREKYYNSKGIGCYMFRIDDNLVVDATMKGNAARFINHSCDPNCYSKVVEIHGHKHIIIFALRRILCGEELTYDYKFPFEEDKIPCTCGARRCRKFLN